MGKTAQQTNADNLVVTDVVETAGCVTYWRIATDVQLTTLAAAWMKYGLDPKLLPEPPKPEVALGRAIADQAAKRTLVRPLARRGAWAVVEETVKEGEAPQYRTLVRVKFEKDNASPITIFNEKATPTEYLTLSTKISGAFRAHRDTLDHGDVSSWLLGMAKTKNSICLRESGGVYFLPRAAVEFWDHVAGAVEEGGAGYVFRIPAMRTDEAIAAITEAISNEALQVSSKMEEELLASGDEALGKRALKTRQTDVEALVAKLNSYEELIGKQLQIRERVELLQAQLAAKIMNEMTEEAAP